MTENNKDYALLSNSFVIYNTFTFVTYIKHVDSTQIVFAEKKREAEFSNTTSTVN